MVSWITKSCKQWLVNPPPPIVNYTLLLAYYKTRLSVRWFSAETGARPALGTCVCSSSVPVFASAGLCWWCSSWCGRCGAPRRTITTPGRARAAGPCGTPRWRVFRRGCSAGVELQTGRKNLVLQIRVQMKEVYKHFWNYWVGFVYLCRTNYSMIHIRYKLYEVDY